MASSFFTQENANKGLVTRSECIEYGLIIPHDPSYPSTSASVSRAPSVSAVSNASRASAARSTVAIPERVNYLQTMPEDMMRHISQFLNPRDVLNLAATSRQTHEHLATERGHAIKALRQADVVKALGRGRGLVQMHDLHFATLARDMRVAVGRNTIADLQSPEFLQIGYNAELPDEGLYILDGYRFFHFRKMTPECCCQLDSKTGDIWYSDQGDFYFDANHPESNFQNVYDWVKTPFKACSIQEGQELFTLQNNARNQTNNIYGEYVYETPIIPLPRQFEFIGNFDYSTRY